MIELDHLHIPLSGVNLIEASAGTGKTYAIACLYLRLLLEQELGPEQILVVTYTEAATKELRGRIRARIREALSVMEAVAGDDGFLNGLRENAERSNGGIRRARETLERALASFDTAAIFTIHGFCQRALQDNAFESGSLYDTELVTDQTALVREVVDDFWRMRFFSEPAPLLGYALRNGFTCDSMMDFLKQIGANPRLKVIPWYEPPEIVNLEHDCRSAYGMLREFWRKSAVEIKELISADKGLGRAADTYRADLLPGLFTAMDAFVAGENPYDLFDGFDKFCSDWIEKRRLKKYPPPQHPFFDCCQGLRDNVLKRFLGLRVELLHFCRERLPLCKRERNIRFFDDLLNDLYLALCAENGPDFAATLRGKYRAALIDEFQDTDPVQYDIFRKIYASTDCPLFLIGDPKQAIYSFRGADIFAYMQAAGDVPPEKRFTLTGNWRSTPRLLTAFNTVFDNTRQPFVYDRISYHSLSSGRPHDAGNQLTFNGAGEAGLQLWHMPVDEEGKPLSVGNANKLAPLAVAAEIARLLRQGAEGTALIGDRPLAPRDIAVIVRSHRQAGFIQEALGNLHIPSVMRSDKSIFDTEEACQVFTLLRALADPGNEGRVRAALVTDILGRTGNDIARLMEDEEAWEQRLQLFRDYHQTWLERGFMVMGQSLVAREGVRGRLLRYPDGERRLTNLLHCFDLIHLKSHGSGLGMEGLISWFGERVAAHEPSEEYLIRLETDEQAVKIVTIHVSKGLEYGLVFCPFMWSGVRGDDQVVSFHDGGAMVKDFGSPAYGSHRALARKEALAENLRLLYVALTRARYRCYLLTGKISDKTQKNRPETSPLSYLFHASPETRMSEDLVATLAGQVSALDHDQVTQQLHEFAAQAGGSVSVSAMPDPVGSLPLVLPGDRGSGLSCRTFSGIVARDWRVASFTSFSAQGKTLIELPDRDETGVEESAGMAPDEEPGGRSIFTFPRGAQAGIFLHGIFEKLDFSCRGADGIASLVAQGLEKHGYDAEWLSHICGMVTAVITTPLESPEGVFSLSALGRGSWVAELEFYFPLRFITPELLGACLLKHGARHTATDLGRVCRDLDFKPARGMVRGFMDMVFQQGGRYYLVDWKSNHLGYRPEDYGQEQLKAAMERSLYPLQYLLYTVALNRYLSLRAPGYDYATHFGGVVYVFLRGASPERGEQCGFFRDLPPGELIDDLTACLIQAGG